MHTHIQTGFSKQRAILALSHESTVASAVNWLFAHAKDLLKQDEKKKQQDTAKMRLNAMLRARQERERREKNMNSSTTIKTTTSSSSSSSSVSVSSSSSSQTNTQVHTQNDQKQTKIQRKDSDNLRNSLRDAGIAKTTLLSHPIRSCASMLAFVLRVCEELQSDDLYEKLCAFFSVVTDTNSNTEMWKEIDDLLIDRLKLCLMSVNVKNNITRTWREEDKDKVERVKHICDLVLKVWGERVLYVTEVCEDKMNTKKNKDSNDKDNINKNNDSKDKKESENEAERTQMLQYQKVLYLGGPLAQSVASHLVSALSDVFTLSHSLFIALSPAHHTNTHAHNSALIKQILRFFRTTQLDVRWRKEEKSVPSTPTHAHPHSYAFNNTLTQDEKQVFALISLWKGRIDTAHNTLAKEFVKKLKQGQLVWRKITERDVRAPYAQVPLIHSPSSRWGHVSWFYDGKMYVLGGRSSLGYFLNYSKVYVLECDRQKWTEHALTYSNLPRGRVCSTSCVWDPVSALTISLSHKNDNNAIAPKSPPPIRTTMMQTQAIRTQTPSQIRIRKQAQQRPRLTNTHIVVFGGCDDIRMETYMNDVNLLDLSRWKWRHVFECGVQPFPRMGHTSSVVGMCVCVYVCVCMCVCMRVQNPFQ